MGKVRIVSHQSRYFRDRSDAGQRLVNELLPYIKGAKGAPIVLGIPRGGVVIAWKIAQILNCPMDVIFCHKLRAPGNPEVAIGAVAENGGEFLYQPLQHAIDPAYLKKEKEEQLHLINERSRDYRAILPKRSLQNQTVIITDDGVAMGFTMRAALWTAREAKPSQLIAAIPVGSEDTVRELARLADATVCLQAPSDFSAVSQFYLDFPAVEDTEILEILKAERLRRELSA